MAVRTQTVLELTAFCGQCAAESPHKPWHVIVSEAIRGRGITHAADVRELRHRIIQTGSAHSARKRTAQAATRRRVAS